MLRSIRATLDVISSLVSEGYIAYMAPSLAKLEVRFMLYEEYPEGSQTDFDEEIDSFISMCTSRSLHGPPIFPALLEFVLWLEREEHRREYYMYIPTAIAVLNSVREICSGDLRKLPITLPCTLPVKSTKIKEALSPFPNLETLMLSDNLVRTINYREPSWVEEDKAAALNYAVSFRTVCPQLKQVFFAADCNVPDVNDWHCEDLLSQSHLYFGWTSTDDSEPDCREVDVPRRW